MNRLARPFLLVGVLAAILALPLGVFASHGFSDVPDSNMFHTDIAALEDSGVTSGCGGGEFCPDDYVTREQMAAFMNRLGALAPNKTPVVNAARVEGYGADHIIRATGETTEDQTLLSTSGLSFVSLTIYAPKAGYVVLTASTGLSAASCTTGCFADAWLRYVDGNENSPVQTVSIATGYDQMGLTMVFPVEEGGNTFSLGLRRGDGDGQIYGRKATISAVYTPFAEAGNDTN